MYISKEDALRYHREPRPGKIEIRITKPCSTQWDLSLAYTPGVAIPCLEIEKNPNTAYDYTNKGNLVAVVTNGTAVLGLGNIGALAGKPVMEGKAVLFKKFGQVDAIDIEVATEDPEEFIQIVQRIAPSFGGINLEDVKAPECFYIEEKLSETLDIPVFHDDQHGTAVISGAGLLNALELTGKKIEDVIVVVSGAGASALACAQYYISLGVQPEHLFMCDSRGVISTDRTDLNPFKRKFARKTSKRTLAEILEGADVFVGLSVGGIVTKDMVKRMADHPIIFAMANPDPEIPYEEAREARPDAIVATGRSDYPNQVNNVLGFPFIFRGALDVRAKKITENMKLAATRALAQLVREPVPHIVEQAYGLSHLEFGPDYIIPKPLDPRVLYWVAPAVAKAALEDGVARHEIDIDAYREQLEERVETGGHLTHVVIQGAKQLKGRVVFAEGRDERIIRAAYQVQKNNIAHPILVGRAELIRTEIERLGITDFNPEIVDPETDERKEYYAQKLFELRQRKGMVLYQALYAIEQPHIFSLMMLHEGDADAVLHGMRMEYDDAVRPVLQIIRTRDGVRAAGLHILIIKGEPIFLADTTIHINPGASELAQIALLATEFVEHFKIRPRVAFLSFSNFGAVSSPEVRKIHEAIEIFRTYRPDVIAEGEMQADVAFDPTIVKEFYPFSQLKESANILIFPNLDSANIAYKLLTKLVDSTSLGPILIGTRKPAHPIPRSSTVDDIVRLAALAVLDARWKNAKITL